MITFCLSVVVKVRIYGKKSAYIIFLKKQTVKKYLNNSVLQMLKSLSVKYYIKMSLQDFLNNILNQIWENISKSEQADKHERANWGGWGHALHFTSCSEA